MKPTFNDGYKVARNGLPCCSSLCPYTNEDDMREWRQGHAAYAQTDATRAGALAYQCKNVRLAPVVSLMEVGGLAAVDAWYYGYDAAEAQWETIKARLTA